ncbi:MAG: hypothetical protein CTY12_06885 [Methylotenera sp.]|nr:MAG: hypothetical protein CTY12_06885 [Methylotenera sp.]
MNLNSNRRNLFKLTIGIVFISMIFSGCSEPESTEAKQIKVCIEDVKLSLNDPNSIEMISTKSINVDDGSHRIALEFTAKNAMGGRVRGRALCGFKTENDLALNPDDIWNKERNLSRSLRGLGINH